MKNICIIKDSNTILGSANDFIQRKFPELICVSHFNSVDSFFSKEGKKQADLILVDVFSTTQYGFSTVRALAGFGKSVSTFSGIYELEREISSLMNS